MQGQVWSFSPPEVDFAEELRSSSPVSLPDHTMADYQDAAERLERADVDMADALEAGAAGSAGESTAD